MGFDKPDLALVVHFQSPGSPIAYYQQVGRAGRALESAHGILRRGHEDVDIQDCFIRSAFPRVRRRRRSSTFWPSVARRCPGRDRVRRQRPSQPHRGHGEGARRRWCGGARRRGLAPDVAAVDLSGGARGPRHRAAASRTSGHATTTPPRRAAGWRSCGRCSTTTPRRVRPLHLAGPRSCPCRPTSWPKPEHSSACSSSTAHPAPSCSYFLNKSFTFSPTSFSPAFFWSALPSAFRL